MRRTVLPDTSLSVSRFIFGTASLFNVGRSADRIRLLDAAHDHGFTHFDTAPYYGFGAAERDLAAMLKRHPDATVTTKVGIYSPGGERQPDALVFARKAAGRVLPVLSRPTTDWSVARARTALDASLRRLGRERIEIYMLHEPILAQLDAEGWLRWLGDEVAAGRVGRFGIAVDETRLEPFLTAHSALTPVVQTIDSIAGGEADLLLRHGRALQITYGYVSDALRRQSTVDVPTILRQALARNADGAVIVSTRQERRLAQYAALAA